MPTYKLSYFDARGRGEVIRLMLTFAGQEFEDIRVTAEDWPALKPNTPFGQMPVLEVDGMMIAQTQAICSYLAKEHGLYGKSNWESCQIDQIVCLVNDFISATVKVVYEKDEAKKAELMKPYREQECPKFLGFFEKLLKMNKTGFFVGSEPTLADIFVYDFLFALQGNHSDLLDNFSLIKDHQVKIGSLPKIKEYIATRKPSAR